MTEPSFLHPAPATIAELVPQVKQLLQQHQVFFGHGTDNVDDETAWLCLWALGLPLDSDLDAIATQAITAADCAKLEQVLQQRIVQRQPTAYITQEAWLQGLPFYIDQRSIIPRSFIAELMVNEQIDCWLNPDSQTILDLCTGNASLAIIAALTYPDTRVDAADISAQALEVAAINVEKHQLQSRIRLIQSDLFQQIPARYDLILCNPPYVNQQSMQQLPAEYLQEPNLALAGGEDGMDFIRNLLAQVEQHLTDSGVLVLEIGNEFDNFVQAFPDLEAIWLETNAGTEQVLLLTKAALQQWFKR